MTSPQPPGPPPRDRRDFLLPVLPIGSGPPDPVAIGTWQMAASDALGAELPHDLLALWLFPEDGGVLLLGPAALAQDQVEVPRPEPFLSQEQLLALEDRFRQAGYASVIASPVRTDERDLGLLLLAAIAAGRFGPFQAIRLFELLQHFEPPFQRLAESMPSEPGSMSLPRARDAEELLGVVVGTGAAARSGAELVTRLSAAIQELLPHDQLEVVMRHPHGGADDWDFVGRDKPSRRWGKEGSPGRGAGAPGPRGVAAIQDRIAEQPTLVIADLAVDREIVWPFRPEGGEAPRLHAMLVAALHGRGVVAGYLFLGSAASDLYRPGDEALIRVIAPVVAAQAAALHALAEVDALRHTVTALEGPGSALARSVRMLAATANLPAATQGIAGLLRVLTGCHSCRFILRMGGDEAVAFEPGELRPLMDLPLIPIEGAAFAPVLTGEAPVLLRPGGDDEQLILPLRVAGKPFGVMVLTGPAGGRLAAVTLTAQQVADTVAPHLELVRREAGLEARSRK